jgi:hypothetical protein
MHFNELLFVMLDSTYQLLYEEASFEKVTLVQKLC